MDFLAKMARDHLCVC